MIQLHGQEEEDYLERLRRLTQVPVIQAFPIAGKADVQRAKKSSADWICWIRVREVRARLRLGVGERAGASVLLGRRVDAGEFAGGAGAGAPWCVT